MIRWHEPAPELASAYGQWKSHVSLPNGLPRDAGRIPELVQPSLSRIQVILSIHVELDAQCPSKGWWSVNKRTMQPASW